MNLNLIKTEQRNSKTTHIDTMSTLDMVRLINEEDQWEFEKSRLRVDVEFRTN